MMNIAHCVDSVTQVEEFPEAITKPVYVEISGQIIPIELINHILFHLPFEDLLNCSRLNKKEWRVLANHPFLLKRAIWRDKAFSPVDWQLHFGVNCPGASEKEEAFNQLPINIGKIFKGPCDVFPEKKLGETHRIIWIPKEMTIDKIEVFTEMGLINHSNVSLVVRGTIGQKTGSYQAEESKWVFVPRKAFQKSVKMDYPFHQKLVDDFRTEYGNVRTVPTAREAVICISSIIMKWKEKIFFQSYTLCQDEHLGFPFIVGLFPSWINITLIDSNDKIGIMGLKKLEVITKI